MDEPQRQLLRRRKQYIADSVQLSDELVANMRRSRLIDDDTVAALQVDRRNRTFVALHNYISHEA